MPETNSSYMAATRRGVPSSPSRWRSSPMASSSSPMSRSTRGRSTDTGISRSVDGDGALVDPDVGNVAIALGDIEAVPHHEVRRDVEPDVAQVQLGALAAFFDEKRAHLEAGGTTGQEAAAQIRQREPAVDDVLHHQDMAVGQVGVEVLDDAHDAAGGGGRPIGRHRHDVDLDRKADVAGQGGHDIV